MFVSLKKGCENRSFGQYPLIKLGVVEKGRSIQKRKNGMRTQVKINIFEMKIYQKIGKKMVKK